MIRRLILKTLAVLTAVLLGLIVLAAIAIFAYFFFAIVFPARMNVTGRVTDIAGNPIRRAEVLAVPLPVNDPYSDGHGETGAEGQRAITDDNGRFIFKKLIASVGVKEGMLIQQYDIVVNADGYAQQSTRVSKNPKSREDVITLADFVLEK